VFAYMINIIVFGLLLAFSWFVVLSKSGRRQESKSGILTHSI